MWKHIKASENELEQQRAKK